MRLDKKQRVMLVLTLCAFSFLGWQMYDLFGGGSSSSAPVAVKAPVAKNMKLAKSAHAPTLAKLAASTTAKPATAGKQYVSMVDQLEMYRMQSQLLQQQLAIARARQQIAKVNASGDVYTPGNSIASVSVTGRVVLRLSYIANQGGQWQATVDQSGHYQTVTAGSLLLDGSNVVSINKTGMLISKAGVTSRLTFNGIVVIKAPKPSKTKV